MEDAEFARTAAMKARQNAELELADTHSQVSNRAVSNTIWKWEREKGKCKKVGSWARSYKEMSILADQ